MIAPYIEPAYIKAVQEFDFDAVYAKYDEQMNETLNNSDDWEWYVLTRQSQYSYRDYESSADRMKAIATVFPLFCTFSTFLSYSSEYVSSSFAPSTTA